ncbi:XrtA/PEP-CTERM system exopolysaccharide export protein [Roseomonas sp. CCTCC AB2023176]|uniref:XrtA/PEP-CTERM system exopolysaccharide export protein n=1 Tax=Roseomonas sp. CCTCC AB2023176 TaxID=3342640 RepID=UPI0035DF88CF
MLILERGDTLPPRRASTRRWRAAVAVLVPLLAVACSSNYAPPQLAALETPATYIIGPGDTLSIFVYRAPELSVELPVRPDGRISMPLVPDIDAAGKTPTQLSEDISRRLREYIREPNVSVIVKSFVGPSTSLVRVIGEAAQPVSIPYREGMTLLDVMIASRGLTRYAAGDRARLVRRGPGGSEVIPVRLSALLKDGDIAQDVRMRPGDTIVIPQSWF